MNNIVPANFDPKWIKPIKFVPNERRIVIELIPEEVELRNTASGSILPIPGSKLVNPVGDIIPTDIQETKLEWWEQFTLIPRHNLIQRPSGTVLTFRKGIVVAVNKGTYQFGKLIECPFKVNDIVIINIKNIEMTFFTDEQAWNRDDSNRIKDRELQIIQEHTIIGKV
jgi:hypothetical protein